MFKSERNIIEVLSETINENSNKLLEICVEMIDEAEKLEAQIEELKEENRDLRSELLTIKKNEGF